eukprot:scaffold2882_cov100-Isochrysis_galbana.AAC.4
MCTRVRGKPPLSCPSTNPSRGRTRCSKGSAYARAEPSRVRSNPAAWLCISARARPTSSDGKEME